MANCKECRLRSTSSDRRRSPKCSELAVVPRSDTSPDQNFLSRLPASGERRYGIAKTSNDGQTSIFLCPRAAHPGRTVEPQKDFHGTNVVVPGPPPSSKESES